MSGKARPSFPCFRTFASEYGGIPAGAIIKVDVTNAAEWWFSRHQKIVETDPLELFDTPGLQPPYEYLWLETMPLDDIPGPFALLLHAEDLLDSGRDRGQEVARWSALAVAYTPSGLATDRDGRPLTAELLVTEAGQLERGGSEWINDHKDDFGLGALMMIAALLAGVSFINCRGVEVVDRVAFHGKPGSRNRYKVTYKALEISAMRRVLDTEGGAGQGPGKAFHLCRGHIREYTADRPLFGKYTGPVWIPAHARGSRRLGVVHKDYVVGSP